MGSSSDLYEQAHRAQARTAELRAETERTLANAEKVISGLRNGRMSSDVHRLVDEVAGLRRAMETRAVIEQAKGIIMARTGLDAEQAFEVLVKQSQHENRKLHDIAHALVDTAVQPQHRRGQSI